MEFIYQRDTSQTPSRYIMNLSVQNPAQYGFRELNGRIFIEFDKCDDRLRFRWDVRANPEVDISVGNQSKFSTSLRYEPPEQPESQYADNMMQADSLIRAYLEACIDALDYDNQKRKHENQVRTLMIDFDRFNQEIENRKILDG